MIVLNKKFFPGDTLPADAVFIGRPSIWGNPYVIGYDGTRTEVIEKYEAYMRSRADLMAALPELKGCNLMCFCSPLPCHGDVLIKLVKEFCP